MINREKLLNMPDHRLDHNLRMKKQEILKQIRQRVTAVKQVARIYPGHVCG